MLFEKAIASVFESKRFFFMYTTLYGNSIVS